MKLNYNFWVKWMVTASIIVIIFGVFMAFSSIFPNNGFAVFDKEINPSFFCDLEIITSSMKDFQSWQYGVGASLMVSWGILILFLSKYPLAKREKWAWVAALTCLMAWFFIDETISLYYRVYFNAIFNLIFLGAFLVPLLMLRKELRE